MNLILTLALKNKINQLVEAVNELLDQSKPDPEYKVPLSGDPEYNKKVSDIEKEKTIQDLHNLENESKSDSSGSVEELSNQVMNMICGLANGISPEDYKAVLMNILHDVRKEIENK